MEQISKHCTLSLIHILIDMQFLGSAYNPNLGSAISLVLMVIILICMGIMNQFDDGENVGGEMCIRDRK